MGEKGTAHHGTKKQQSLSRADDESLRAGLGDTCVLKGTCVTALAGRGGHTCVDARPHTCRHERHVTRLSPLRQAFYRLGGGGGGEPNPENVKSFARSTLGDTAKS